MIRQIMFTVFILTKIGAIPQDKHTLRNEYTKALLYLTTDEKTCDVIKKFKKKWTKDKQTGCEFNLSRYIVYLPLPVNSKELNNERFNPLKYNYFEMEENSVVRNLHKESSSELYLLFSKPFENYLTAEFRLNTTGDELDMALNASGPSMHMLFVFNGEGNIIKVAVSYSYYN